MTWPPPYDDWPTTGPAGAIARAGLQRLDEIAGRLGEEAGRGRLAAREARIKPDLDRMAISHQSLVVEMGPRARRVGWLAQGPGAGI